MDRAGLRTAADAVAVAVADADADGHADADADAADNGGPQHSTRRLPDRQDNGQLPLQSSIARNIRLV